MQFLLPLVLETSHFKSYLGQHLCISPSGMFFIHKVNWFVVTVSTSSCDLLDVSASQLVFYLHSKRFTLPARELNGFHKWSVMYPPLQYHTNQFHHSKISYITCIQPSPAKTIRNHWFVDFLHSYAFSKI